MIGPGKYDDLCTQTREAAEAMGAMIFILGGKHGDGFSAQLPITAYPDVPLVLRRLADEIERRQPAVEIAEQN